MVEGKLLSKLATWVLILLFILIFVFAFYSKDKGFISWLANKALAAERFLPAEPSKEVKAQESLPQSAVDVQKEFIDDISRFSDKGKCLLNLRSMEGLENLRMEIVNFDGKVVSRIEKPVGKEGGLKLNPVETQDKKLEVCIINPEEFYKCYLIPDDKICTSQLYNKVDSVAITKDSILIGGNLHKLAQGILFKPEKDKVCFIPVHSSTGDSWYKVWQIFTKWGCDAGKNTIDNDCLSAIKKQIPACGK